MKKIIFYIPAYLRAFADGRSEVSINTTGKDVREVLTSLWRVCPGLRDRVVTEQGEVRQHLNIFVGQENIRDCSGLTTAVMDGYEITILPSVSGG